MCTNKIVLLIIIVSLIIVLLVYCLGRPSNLVLVGSFCLPDKYYNFCKLLNNPFECFNTLSAYFDLQARLGHFQTSKIEKKMLQIIRIKNIKLVDFVIKNNLNHHLYTAI